MFARDRRRIAVQPIRRKFEMLTKLKQRADININFVEFTFSTGERLYLSVQNSNG